MGQWNHIDCSQPSPDSPDYLRWLAKQQRIFNGDEDVEDFAEYADVDDDFDSREDS